jgi:glycosyltransferase involved in cell wall biosynthesis
MRFLVVYNGPANPDGGSSGTVWQTNEALKRLGHHVDTIYADGLRRVVPHHNLYYAFELPRRMLEAVRAALSKADYDVVLISQPYGYLAGKWLRASESDTLYVHRSHGHELVVSHQLTPWEEALGAKRSYWRRLASRLLAMRLNQQARLALKYADGTVVPSTFDRDFLIEHERVDPAKVRSIFHASVPAYLESEPKPYTEERHRKILYVGNVTRIKGGDVLWKAGAEILRRFPQLTLTIVTSRADHANAIAGFAADVAERIRFQEWVGQNELMNIYDQHGLQIIPSRYEGASKAHYEGMSRGLCLICSAVGAMRDTITSGEDGLLVPPGDANGFVAAVCHAVERYDVSRSIAEKARNRSLDFTWERTAVGIVEYAGELLSERAELGRERAKQTYAVSRN